MSDDRVIDLAGGSASAMQPDAAIPQEELRFGVVLNGGVSLAVWMGGVVKELDDVTRATSSQAPSANGDAAAVHDTRSIYRSLLDLVRSRARADVIAGTSAGGINGAALALAQLNENADLGSLRDIWGDQGRMESLLREPFQGSPPSLLKGDEYFYPALERALDSLAQGWDPITDRPWSAASRDRSGDRPVDLTITTTLLKGARYVSVDSLGQRIPERVHDATFMFAKSPLESGPDHFADERRARTIRAMALAARCTAGFPVAFEPSFVPVHNGSQPKPDMADFASWADQGTPAPGEDKDADASRFAVDGGLLANMPTRHVLRAIQDMPARDLVRRVVLLIHPHAPVDELVPADKVTAPPALTSTLGGLLGALQAQGSRTYVEELDEHNRRASGRRATRADILRTIDAADAGQLHRLAVDLWPHYRQLCARRVTSELAGTLADAQWSVDRIQREAGAPPASAPTLHLLPEAGELTMAAVAVAAGHWGVDAAIGVADAAGDFLRRLAWQVKDSAPGVMAAREAVLQARSDLQSIRDGRLPADEKPATAAPPQEGAGTPSETREAMASTISEFRRTVAGGDAGAPGPAAPLPASAGEAAADAAVETVQSLRVAQHLMVIASSVVSTRGSFEQTLAGSGLDPALRPWRVVVLGVPGEAATLNRLFELHVTTTCVADENVTEAVNAFDVVQISLQTDDPFAVVTRTGDDKLAGMSLSRFGGFLKRSWRMNDWTWGRLDAATMLAKIILDPLRLRRVAVMSPPDSPLAAVAAGPDAAMRARDRAALLVAQLTAEFFPSSTAADPAIKAAVKQAEREADTELFQVFLPVGSVLDLPPAAPALADLAAWALHLRIITEEVPQIAAAVKVDEQEGAHKRSRGQVFLAQYEDLIAKIQQLPPRVAQDDPATHAARLDLGLQALRAFDRAGIGREALSQEGASDQMIRTATTAASVAATVLDGDRSGLTAFKPVTRTIRGSMLLPYWITNGLTSGGGVARLLALGALALGGVLLTLSLLSVIGSWGAVLGGGIAIFGLAYAALRSGSLLHGVMLLAPVVPLAVIGYEMRRQPQSAAATANSQVVLIAAVSLVLGLILIGSLPADVPSPAAVGRTAAHGVVEWLRGLAILVRSIPDWVRGHVVVTVVAAALLVVAVAVVGLRGSWAPALPAGLTGAGARSLWFGLAVVAGTAFGAWRAHLTAARMRVFLPVSPGDRPPDEDPGWQAGPVTHPVAATAGWSVVYGVVSGVVAVLLWRVEPLDPGMEALAWAFAVVALVLVVVVPLWLPHRVWANEVRRLAPEASGPLVGDGGLAQQAQLLESLVRQGLTRARLVQPVSGHPQVLRLTPYGIRVAARVVVPPELLPPEEARSVTLPDTRVVARSTPEPPPGNWKHRTQQIAVYPDARRGAAG